jgi:hypothetical protein
MDPVDIIGREFDDLFESFLQDDGIPEDPEVSGATVMPESWKIDDWWRELALKTPLHDGGTRKTTSRLQHSLFQMR